MISTFEERIRGRNENADPQDLLKQWIWVWDISRKIRSERVPKSDQSSALIRCDQLGELGNGEILAIDNSLNPVNCTGRILFVAVLCTWMDDYMLVVPFGSLPVPGTRGEISVSEPPRLDLSVLETWNSQTVPEEILRKSTFYGYLSETDRRLAIEAFWENLNGEPGEAHDLINLLPPIKSPTDPRFVYQNEEWGMMRFLQTE